MREILFRGKRIGYSGWLYGIPDDEDHNADFPCIIPNKVFYTTDDYPLDWEVDPETIGQFTGLLDKYGNRIFEGDIVDILTENEEIGVVAYEDGGFWVNADGFNVDFHSNINGTDLEVIGNIHDNPELLRR